MKYCLEVEREELQTIVRWLQIAGDYGVWNDDPEERDRILAIYEKIRALTTHDSTFEEGI